MIEKKLNSQTQIITGVFNDILYDYREYELLFGEMDAETAARANELLEIEFDRQEDVGEWVVSYFAGYRRRA
jgi:hypothetical protein